jgi:hypothetical protein
MNYKKKLIEVALPLDAMTRPMMAREDDGPYGGKKS